MDPRFAKVDELFAPYDKTNSPGCSVAIFHKGEILYRHGYGLANLEHAIPNQPWTRFYLASMSKQFTAFCIALLEEDGKLSLDQDIREFFPEIPAYQAPISVRHLVHHTSGLRDYLTLGLLAGGSFDDIITMPEALERIARQHELNFAPGSEYLYSNSGYILMALIVEKASGKSFRQYAHENIFEPLGMQRTHAHDNHHELVPQRATAYTPGPQGWQINVPNFDVVGDGGIYSCVEDLFLWDQNFYHNRLGKGRPELIERVLTRGVLNGGEEISYAFGLNVEQFNGLREVAHAGGYGGYGTEMVRYPDQAFSAVVLSNCGSFSPTEMARKISAIFLADVMVKPDAAAQEPVSIHLPASSLADKAGLYLSADRGFALDITLKENQLSATMRSFTIPLATVDENTFVSCAGPVKARIEFGEHGGIPGLLLALQGAKPFSMEKTAAVIPSEAELAELCGGYTSTELDASALVHLREGSLALKLRQQIVPLKPAAQDMFLFPEGLLQFERAPDGQANGFRIQAGRVRNILFRRS